MRLADDERARVPFALLGVVLVLGSAAYAATMADRPRPGGRPNEGAALERAEAAAAAAVHRATREAADAAARDPVVEPADTPGGRVLDEKETFRDYLRVRIYLAARSALDATEVTVGAVRATTSLPATPNASALRDAKRRVHVERVDGGLRVRVENLTVKLRRGGRVVERRTVTVVRTVATSVLAVHDRVVEYVERLNRGPLDGPGLGRRLTARLFALAWVRGYAQFGGAPIRNVVANRHVELLTNGALLSVQRSTFGRSDPAGRRAVATASAVVGATDVMHAGAGRLDEMRHRVVQRPGVPVGPAPPLPEPRRPPVAASGNVTVGVNLTADDAFAAFVTGDGDTTREGVSRSVYSADVRVRSTVAGVERGTRPPPDPPGPDWALVDADIEREAAATAGDAPPPSAGDGWHRLESYARTVVVDHTVVRTWADDGSTTTTTGSWTDRYRVGLAVVGRHAPSDYVPRRGIDVVHERGGPLDGPNLRNVDERAVGAVRERRGTPDELAVRVVEGTLRREPMNVDGERPDGLDATLYEAVAQLRERVRDVTVSLRRDRVGAGEVNPAARLASVLRDRRAELLDVPGTYGSVADKARVAARAAYLAAVVDRLQERAAAAAETRSRIDERLVQAGLDPATLSAALDADRTPERPANRPVATGGPLGERNATVRGAPPYLTVSPVTHQQVRAVPPGEQHHPLVARNVNYFTLPSGDVADTVVAHLFDDPGNTDVGTAAQALRSANETLAREPDAALARRRDELRAAVRRSLRYVGDRLRRILLDENVNPVVARAAIVAGFDRWETIHARGLAAANGSLAASVAAAADERADLDERGSDLLGVRLRVELAAARRTARARPSRPTVNRSASMAQSITNEGVRQAVGLAANATVREVGERMDGDLVVPQAGLPLAPVPGYWYVTTNVWSATVYGEYARFAVSVPANGPDGRRLTYERDGAAVALDWDDDGSSERLGRAGRVSFRVRTAAVVVVPPGQPGVGDRNGDLDERSPGWPPPDDAAAPE